MLDGGIPRRENEIERRSWSLSLWKYVMRCTIWYHLHNLKNVKSTQGGMLLLVKLQAKWYQIGQNITNIICEYLQGTLLKRQFTHTFLLHINYSYNHWWIVFVVWLTDERRLALFPAGTIVRDLHHRESPTRRAGFEPAQNLSLGLVEWSCAVVITTTPRCHSQLSFTCSNSTIETLGKDVNYVQI